MTTGGQKEETLNGLIPVDPRIRENNKFPNIAELYVTPVVIHLGRCTLNVMRCYGCGETGYNVSNYPKVDWN